MGRADRIEQLLVAALQPLEMTITDESHLHEGHAGARPDGETHYHVRVVSSRFSGLSRLARHRLVNEALVKELTNGLHALAIEAKAPGE